MSEITRNEAIQIVEDIRTAISAGSVTNTMEAQVLDYCVKVLGGRIEEASQSGNIVNLADVVAFLAGISSATTLRSLLSDITGKIPSEASGSNKLADKAFVTSLTTALQDAVNVINANIGNGYVYAGIATPSGTPVSGKVFYLAKEAGTYTNFGGLVVTQGINILKYNGTAWSQEQVVGIDNVPTAGSPNLVKSGGVAKEYGSTVLYTGYTSAGQMNVSTAVDIKTGDAIKVYVETTQPYTFAIRLFNADNEVVQANNSATKNTEYFFTAEQDIKKIAAVVYNAGITAGLPVSVNIQYGLAVAIEMSEEKAEEAFNDLMIEDTTASDQATKMTLSLQKNDGTVEEPDIRTLDSIDIPQATLTKAGLLPASSQWDPAPVPSSQKLMSSGSIAKAYGGSLSHTGSTTAGTMNVSTPVDIKEGDTVKVKVETTIDYRFAIRFLDASDNIVNTISSAEKNKGYFVVVEGDIKKVAAVLYNQGITAGISVKLNITYGLATDIELNMSEINLLNNLISGIKNKIDNGYVYAGIATPLGTPVSGKVFYLAKEAGAYTNFGGLAVAQGINILKFNGTAWSQEQVVGIDNVPTAGSPNLVKSGGVAKEYGSTVLYTGYTSAGQMNVSTTVDIKTGDAIKVYVETTQPYTFAIRLFNADNEIVQANNSAKKNTEYFFTAEQDIKKIAAVVYNAGITAGISVKLKITYGLQAEIEYINSDLTDKIGTNSGNIEKNLDLIRLGGYLPDYYDEYMQEKKSLIQETILGCEHIQDSFVFFTDAHYDGNACNSKYLIQRILDDTPVKKVFFGGDVCDFGSREVLEGELAEHLRYLGMIDKSGRIYKVKGNHDFYVPDDAVHPTQTFSYPEEANKNLSLENLVGAVINGNGDGVYYYYDEPKTKTRYIILDVIQGNLGQCRYNRNQLDWFAATLNSTPQYSEVVIISHIPLTDTVSFTTEEKHYKNILGIINAAQAKGSYTTVSDADENFVDAEIEYDMSGFGGHILMCISGHDHMDSQTYQDGVLHVTIPADKRTPYDFSSRSFIYPIKERSQVDDRVFGTVTEQCFDVVNLSLYDRIIDFIRIGCGNNRRFHVNPIDLNVGGTIQLTTGLTGNWFNYNSKGAVFTKDSDFYAYKNWSLIDQYGNVNGDIVSVNNGLVTALQQGDATVYIQTSGWDCEFWYIRVS